MNETIRQIFARKSVRVFLDKEISETDKGIIIEAAKQAPSGGNTQPYTIIDITDQKIKDELAILCDHQPFIAKGKMVLLFVADFQRYYDLYQYGDVELEYQPQESNLLMSIQDTAIAAQNSVVAAEALGIGSCYIGDIVENAERVRELFDIPPYAMPLSLLVFGYPTQQQKERVKPKRIDRKFNVFENKYHRLTKEELKELYLTGEDRSDEAFVEFARKQVTRKYHTDFGREMVRSIKVWLENWR